MIFFSHAAKTAGPHSRKVSPMKLKALAVALGSVLALAACDPNQGYAPSNATYRTSDLGRVAAVSDQCRVLSARQISILQDDRTGQNRQVRNEVLGTLAGAAVGAAVGNQIGGGDGKRLATVLGGLGGAAVGGNIAGNVATAPRTGIEYVVSMTSAGRSRTMSVTQGLNRGEGYLPAGSRCNLVTDGRTARVLPG